ncbi:MAG TPA: energy transducer TonB [Chitinophagaceae bacterium]|nr:energy transducer TonB [Chitinophagaceae bacterium]
MEVNKILSANILDLVFDNRNKEYGAYELRVTYPERVKKSLIVVFIIVAAAVGGAALASSIKPSKERVRITPGVIINPIPDEPIPPPEKPKPLPPAEPPKTIRVTTPVIVDDNEAEPMATEDDKTDAKIDVATNDKGPTDDRLATTDEIGDHKDIIEAKTTDPGPRVFVEVDAKFIGNWEKFLTKNLNPDVPVSHGAPAGRYTVIIQFVVDLQGNVSDIKALTAHGYGMEEEAIHALKKATKWEPAIQNGYPVKAYRKQPITFVVEAE